jgi:hypothetical protein
MKKIYKDFPSFTEYVQFKVKFSLMKCHKALFASRKEKAAFRHQTKIDRINRKMKSSRFKMESVIRASVSAEIKSDVTFKHSGHSGDIIYSLPAIKALSRGRPATLYLQPGQPAYFPSEMRPHPVGDVKLNAYMANALLPLLRIQPYLSAVEIYSGQSIDYDLDAFRDVWLPTDRGHIARWYFWVYGIAGDLSKPWLHISGYKSADNAIVLARSHRYQNGDLDFHFLNDFGEIRFVGTRAEYEDMKRILPNLKYVECNDFLCLAHVIRSARFFIGNQSFPYAIAEALKVPRVLEVYPYCPNVIPEGENAYEAFFQPTFKYIVEQLMGRTEMLCHSSTAN